MKKLCYLSAVAIFAAFTFAGCSNKTKEQPEPSAVIDFEGAILLSETGGDPYTFSNILWGKEKATDNIFDDIIYSENGADFGHYYEFTSFGDFWSGFALSSNSDKTDLGMDYSNQFCVHASGSSKFALGYDGTWGDMNNDYDIPKIIFEKPCTVLSARIANSTKSYHYCKNNPEGVKDLYFNLVVNGYKGTSQTNSLTIPLASEGKVLEEWKEFDFSSLGEIDRIEFAFDSNDKNDYGLRVPKYFCIDDIKIK